MTDKVQKIREEVEKLKSNLIYGACSSQIAMETICKEEAFNEVLAILDTMQEESVSEDILDVSRIDYRLQHKSIEDGIKYHAEEYSFNIESVLYNQLTGEQQKLWRKELERAVISGGYYGWGLSRDKRYKENQEPVSEDLKTELNKYIKDHFTIDTEQLDRFGIEEKDYMYSMDKSDMLALVDHFTNWQKTNLWKPADGDDLPEIDREVIALVGLEGFFEIPPDKPVKLSYKVVFAHRPPEYWDGKNILTGKVTRNYPKTYDKGGWNIPNVKYWLDIELPNEIEL